MPTTALHSTLNISETVRDRGLVAKDHQYEMTYRESNSHMTDDVLEQRHMTVRGQTGDPNTLRAQNLQSAGDAI